MQIWFAEARQELKTSQEQLSERWNELLLKQSNDEKAQEEAAAQAAKDDAQLRERRIDGRCPGVQLLLAGTVKRLELLEVGEAQAWFRQAHKELKAAQD